MKYFKLLFSKNEILTNIDSNVLISILLLNIILSINVILKEFDNFFNKIKQLVLKIKENNKNNNDIKKTNKTKNILKNEKISIYKRKNKIKKKEI